MITALRTLLFIVLIIPVPITPAAAGAAITDAELSRAIERAYRRDYTVDPDAIEVSVRDGIVTLGGTTDNLLSWERAARIAGSYKGVRAVINRIQVVPSTPRDYPDANLQLEVEIALAENPATEEFEIDVTLRDGIVTLSGSADSWAEKHLAGRVAKGVSGVREVHNEIDVHYEHQRSDREIREEIAARMANDVLVDDLLVRIEVAEGSVTLSGTVGSHAERRRAYENAWVSGVQAVQMDALEVSDMQRDRLRRTHRPENTDNEMIAGAVADVFRYDPRIRPTDVNVAVSNGVVTLSGVVAGLGEKLAAGQDARSVTGVRRVYNHLQVHSGQRISPAELERRIRSMFARDPFLHDADIVIRATPSGEVILSGSTDNSYLKQHAARLVATGMKGVTRLVNRIRYDYVWTERPDGEIREDVEELLFWNPFVDEGNIAVRVSAGVVTLSGRVDNLSEEQAALDTAWQAEPRDVRNEMSVINERYGPYYWDRAYELPNELAGAAGATARTARRRSPAAGAAARAVPHMSVPKRAPAGPAGYRRYGTPA